MKTIDDALRWADTFDSPHSKHMSLVMLAAEVRRLRDEVNGLTGSLERAEAALKEAQAQEPCAFWWIGPDGKDNGGPYRGKPSDFAIDNARNMGCEPILLYASPVPAAVAAPAVPKKWMEFVRCVADNYDCDSDAHRYGTPCGSCDARAILQSTGDQK